MNIKELRSKTTKELQDLLMTKKKALENVAADILQKKEKNVKKSWFLRKEIAVIKTLINESKILKEK